MLPTATGHRAVSASQDFQVVRPNRRGRKDWRFPRGGDIEAARKWLQDSSARGDAWEALEDAELDYQKPYEA